MFLQEIETYKLKKFISTNARLLWEWEAIERRFQYSKEIHYTPVERNAAGIPVTYRVTFNIRSFCGVMKTHENGFEAPVFADKFIMGIFIPNNYPSADCRLTFRFFVQDDSGNDIPHPWHPNIRYFGDFAGRVCLNTQAHGTYTDLALYIDKVASYLKYEKYHANNTPPYPEDPIVSDWILAQAEPNGWIEKLKKFHYE